MDATSTPDMARDEDSPEYLASLIELVLEAEEFEAMREGREPNVTAALSGMPPGLAHKVSGRHITGAAVEESVRRACRASHGSAPADDTRSNACALQRARIERGR